MARGHRHSARKKPLTREMLLPLPLATTRALSLENHLALVAIRSGNGEADHISCLLKVVYLAWFMLDKSALDERALLRHAEHVLDRSMTSAEHGAQWTLPHDDYVVIEQILTLHDRQLASLPSHRYALAWKQLTRLATGSDHTRLPTPGAS
ncbi:Fis family transcriptional regulator [Paraburkholderia kururiensis]|uniref:hypothetical protein n=1 Tax=Paraburkholderia kururiensis TaxID=984307 RepID=UPI0039A5D78A